MCVLLSGAGEESEGVGREADLPVVGDAGGRRLVEGEAVGVESERRERRHASERDELAKNVDGGVGEAAGR
tara:strand:- start:81 stop:293 length:213 start_codon:yes stop_codon:yes gene_type:complete